MASNRPDTNKEKRGTEAFRKQRAQDFKDQKVKSAKDFDFNQYNPGEKQNPGGGTHVSQAEVRHLKQGAGGLKKKIAALDAQKEAGATFGKKAQASYDSMVARQDAKDRAKQRKDEAATGSAAVIPQNNQANNTEIENTQAVQVDQSNPQTSTVNGNDNYVNQNQDNSVRVYGGDNRSFVYNSNGGEGADTPATMATLGEYFAPDDSAGAQASRLDRHVTQNRDNQKQYSDTSHIAMGAIKRAEQNAYIDPKKLDQRIGQRSQYHQDRATIRGAAIFGDISGLEGPDWNSAKPAEEVKKPDFNKMYDTYTDF